ncbi:hypothetical protein SAMN02910398_04095 [Butyrivibrio sp. YAB3001]|nr:hypothetical protein SAMN02910398_04095 [Butyrivibrio sp. YAB3001]
MISDSNFNNKIQKRKPKPCQWGDNTLTISAVEGCKEQPPMLSIA